MTPHQLEAALFAAAMCSIRQRRHERRRDILGTMAIAGAAFTCSTVAVVGAVVLWLLMYGGG